MNNMNFLKKLKCYSILHNTIAVVFLINGIVIEYFLLLISFSIDCISIFSISSYPPNLLSFDYIN